MKKKILFVFMAFIVVFGVIGCGIKSNSISAEEKNEKSNDDTNINDSVDESHNNETINSNDNTEDLATYDYVVYCEIGKRVGRAALYGEESYGEYYIKNSSVVGLKSYIVPPKILTDSELDDVIRKLKENYGEEGTTIKSDRRNIIVMATEKNSVVSSLTIEDIHKMLNDSRYYCYKK